MNHYKVSLSLRIYHPTISSSEIIEIIQLPVVVKHSVGELRKTPKGNVLDGVYSETYCCFDLELKVMDEIEVLLSKWILFLESKVKDFSQITESGGRVEFFAGIFLSGDTGFDFSVEKMKALVDSSIELSIAVYV